MIYIAGPLTSPDPAVVRLNIVKAAEAYFELVHRRIHAFCPHLSGLIPGAFDLTYDLWMYQCLETLRRADGIWMLPDWQSSSGSVCEHDLATAIKLPMYYSLEQVLAQVLAR